MRLLVGETPFLTLERAVLSSCWTSVSCLGVETLILSFMFTGGNAKGSGYNGGVFQLLSIG
jgi:hypothetical protein